MCIWVSNLLSSLNHTPIRCGLIKKSNRITYASVIFVWYTGRLGVNPRIDIKKKCVEKRLPLSLEFVSCSRYNSQHKWGDMHGQLRT